MKVSSNRLELFSMRSNPLSMQLIRYGLWGLTVNAIGYLVYIIMTYYWFEPETVISIMYPFFACLSYWGHGRYSFVHNNSVFGWTLVRYVLMYSLCYVINIVIIAVFVEKLGMNHVLVQGGAIPCVAIVMFIGLKYFVFSHREKEIK